MTASIGRLLDVTGGTLHGSATEQLPTGSVLDRTVDDATHDSRQIEPGWLYCCVPGANVDGHDFATQAVRRGATALLVERALDLRGTGADIAQIRVPEVRAAMGPVAAEIHGRPSERLTVIGVTGTNGKSSIIQLLADIWSEAGVRCEMIGTLAGPRTTPEGTDLQRTLAQFVAQGVTAVAMEVSSHALSLQRVAGTRFALAMFTNLGHDHLDFHHDVESYFQAKALLFRPELSDQAVVNLDDSYGLRLHEDQMVPTTGYSLAEAEGLTGEGTVSRFRWRDRPVEFHLAGSHNVLNALGAAAATELLGIESANITRALGSTRPVRGRFEGVHAGQEFHVAVDYAHTPDALVAALGAARQIAASNRVIVVFGCGGDRDAQKRAEMGRVAEKDADLVIVTSDNPRSERPSAIVDDILGGIERPADALVELDRRAAIGLAIGEASTGDVVLIAGKGHETDQIVGDLTLEFDDRQVALEALNALGNVGSSTEEVER